MTKKSKKKLAAPNLAKTSSEHQKLPLIEHLYELRRRLFYVAVSVAGGSIFAYAVQQHIIAILLRPSHGQHFIYTSPLGGINFLFSVCLDVGIAISIPIIIYHLLRFLEPLMKATTAKFIFFGSVTSGIIALVGILFGYFIGLPAALNFLLHQFTSAQIAPLVTIQSYMSFVTVYLLGSALMFQLPLILIFINRIKPLKPSGLIHHERHAIIFAFVAGFIMNPTPNLLDQLIVVAPLLIMYQVGIGVIWYINRPKAASRFEKLRELDATLQAERAERARRLKPLVSPATNASLLPLQPALEPIPVEPENVPVDQLPDPQSVVNRRYFDDFGGRRRNYQQFSPRATE